MSDRPEILFCIRSAGKSQMAAGLVRHLADDAVEVSWAGTPSRHGSQRVVRPVTGRGRCRHVDTPENLADEPSERGIDGIERTRLVRDGISRHVGQLAQQLAG
jgi:arsenate-mycothiol transferase